MASTRSQSKWRFQLRRFSGLMKLLLSNRMALAGMILLFASVFVAVAAPILTPYTPDQILLSGDYSQPEWVMQLPDGYYLSKNVVSVGDPLFNSAAAVQAWSVSASPAIMSNLVLSYAPGVASVSNSRGSLQLTYAGASNATVVLSHAFQYPYRGPPSTFEATISYLVSGAGVSRPVGVGVSVNRGDQTFPLWNASQTSSGSWAKPTYTINSLSPIIKDSIGATGADLSPAQIIFSARQSYSYQVIVTFTGPQKINLDELQITLLGTAFGPLGTDFQGSDVLTQLIYGTRISLLVGLTATGIGIGLGLVIGLLAGFLGRFVDEVLMRFTDMILVIPGLPLLIVLVAVLGANIYNIIFIIGFFSWMGFARIIRSQVLSLKERPFVEAARASGAGTWRIMGSHIFPNIVSLTYVNLALTVPAAILTEAALEFLGLGDPNIISWGHMFYLAEISNALNVWWWVIPPGIAIALVSLSFVLIGYALDEIFNPKLRRRQ